MKHKQAYIQEISDVSDGKQVETVLVGLYLNSFDTAHPEFMERMGKESQDVRDNFIYLIMKWMRNLAARKEYEWDERNAESVKLAKYLEPELDGLSVRITVQQAAGHPNAMAVCYREDKSMEAMMKQYLLSVDSEGAMFCDFIKAMEQEHRTLQQNFTRFCLEWCKWSAENASIKCRYRIESVIAAAPAALPMI